MKSFFAGLGLGAVVAVLYAPRSGAESRRAIAESAQGTLEAGRNRMQPLIRQARRRGAAINDRLQEVTRPVREQARRASSAARETVQDVADRARSVTGGGIMSILNDWPQERLIEIDGIGPVLAGKIIQHRPYESLDELIEAKHLPPSAIQSLRDAA